MFLIKKETVNSARKNIILGLNNFKSFLKKRIMNGKKLPKKRVILLNTI